MMNVITFMLLSHSYGQTHIQAKVLKEADLNVGLESREVTYKICE